MGSICNVKWVLGWVGSTLEGYHVAVAVEVLLRHEKYPLTLPNKAGSKYAWLGAYACFLR
jgi:hypothetical protein